MQKHQLEIQKGMNKIYWVAQIVLTWSENNLLLVALQAKFEIALIQGWKIWRKAIMHRQETFRCDNNGPCALIPNLNWGITDSAPNYFNTRTLQCDLLCFVCRSFQMENSFAYSYPKSLIRHCNLIHNLVCSFFNGWGFNL